MVDHCELKGLMFNDSLHSQELLCFFSPPNCNHSKNRHSAVTDWSKNVGADGAGTAQGSLDDNDMGLSTYHGLCMKSFKMHGAVHHHAVAGLWSTIIRNGYRDHGNCRRLAHRQAASVPFSLWKSRIRSVRIPCQGHCYRTCKAMHVFAWFNRTQWNVAPMCMAEHTSQTFYFYVFIADGYMMIYDDYRIFPLLLWIGKVVAKPTVSLVTNNLVLRISLHF